MEISKEDFERVIELSYKRGRVMRVKPVKQEEIESCIADVYDLLLDIDGEIKNKGEK